jgi:hypothetical protein
MAVAAGLMRLIPHPYNFTPVAGLGLFGGARLRSWRAYVLPLAVMAVSDVLLWAIQGRSDYSLWQYAFNPWVYACFLLAVVWGRLLIRNGGAGRIAAVSVLVSVQFFVVTNFGVWLSGSLYSRDLSGLIACYVAAIPFFGTNAPPLGFFGNQVIGDLFYTGLLFGLYALLRGGVLLPRRLRQPAVARMP